MIARMRRSMATGVLAGLVGVPVGATAGDPLPMTEVADGVHVFEGVHEDVGEDIANIGFIVGEDAVAVVDTGGSLDIGERLLERIRATTDAPVRYVINTHMHPDHVFGNAAFEHLPDDPVFIGHEALPEDLAARAHDYRQILERALEQEVPESWVVLPDQTVAVDAAQTLDLGGRILEVEAHPTAHTGNDLTVFDKDTGTWWLSDLLFVDRVPAVDGSIRGWVDVTEALMARDADRAVPGHGPASVEWPDAATPQLAYLTALRDDVREAIAQGQSLRASYETVAREAEDDWALFDLYHERNVGAAFAELEWE